MSGLSVHGEVNSLDCDVEERDGTMRKLQIAAPRDPAPRNQSCQALAAFSEALTYSRLSMVAPLPAVAMFGESQNGFHNPDRS